MKKGKHVNFHVKQCGMFVNATGIMGASPDGLISCDCHGDGVLEIKCATKYFNEDPKSANVIKNLDYICNDTVSKSHKYYSQMQLQMGITGRKWCDFVVFTCKCLEDAVDPLIIRVEFDKVHYLSIVNAAEKFWYEHLLREMVLKEMVSGQVECEIDTIKSNCDSEKQATNNDHCYASVLNSNTSSGNNCPICHVVCGNEEDIKTFVQRSIGCDGCNAWFHFSCIGMTAKKLKEMGENNWFCTVCAVEMEN